MIKFMSLRKRFLDLSIINVHFPMHIDNLIFLFAYIFRPEFTGKDIHIGNPVDDMNLDAANSLKRCSSAPLISPPTTIIRTTAPILARPMNTTKQSNITSTNSTASRSR